MARLTLQEIIDVPTPSCHATTVARVGGETLLCWFGEIRKGCPLRSPEINERPVFLHHRNAGLCCFYIP